VGILFTSQFLRRIGQFTYAAVQKMAPNVRFWYQLQTTTNMFPDSALSTMVLSRLGLAGDFKL
jgi:hypothetical protein